MVSEGVQLLSSHRLFRDMLSIIQPIQGRVGIYAEHLHSESLYTLNHQKRFHMASTYKIPITLYCLSRVEQGIISLEQKIAVEAGDIRAGSGNIKKTPNLYQDGIPLSELIIAMMEYSDNTATDLVLKLIGGPKAVTAYIRSLGIEQMEVNRSCLKALADYSGIYEIPENEKLSLNEFTNLEIALPPDVRENAKVQFFDDLRDTATPEAMGILLKKFQMGSLLNAAHTKFLFKAMSLCKTGMSRIRAKMPLRTVVAEKTGTLGSMVNDAGIILLPNGLGALVLVINIDDITTSVPLREEVISKIAKRIYEELV